MVSSQEFCKKTKTSVCSVLSNTILFLQHPRAQEPQVVESQIDPVSKTGSSSLSSPVREPCSDVPFDKDNQTSTSLSQPVVENSIVVEEVVCSPPKKGQKKFNEELIIMGEKLTDIEIEFAQRILKSQFPNINIHIICINVCEQLLCTLYYKIIK